MEVCCHFPPFHVCVHIVFACVHVQACACMWRPKVNVENHPQLLFHFIHQSRVLQSNSEYIGMVGLASQRALGNPIPSAFRGYKSAATHTWYLCGFWDPSFILTIGQQAF